MTTGQRSPLQDRLPLRRHLPTAPPLESTTLSAVPSVDDALDTMVTHRGSTLTDCINTFHSLNHSWMASLGDPVLSNLIRISSAKLKPSGTPTFSECSITRSRFSHRWLCIWKQAYKQGPQGPSNLPSQCSSQPLLLYLQIVVYIRNIANNQFTSDSVWMLPQWSVVVLTETCCHRNSN